MLTIRQVALNEMEALAESHAAFRYLTGLGVAEGGVLPSEFVAEFLPRARGADPWLGVWAIDDGVVVGSGGFKSAPLEGVVEIGYGVAPSVEGRGVATAIAKAMVSFAMENGARAVIAHTLPDGFASQRVLAKAGFTLVGPVVDPEDGDVLRFTYNKL
jgi:RimJ/RimL family protein N-acetyltransferase